MSNKEPKRTVIPRWIPGVVIPFIASLPPILGAIANTKDPTGLPDWLEQSLKDYFSHHPLLLAGTLFWPTIVVVGSYVLSKVADWLSETGAPTAEELLVFINSLDTPVGRKLKRFGKAANRVRHSTTKEKPTAIFREITQPEEQIALLVEGLHVFFLHGIEKKEQLKVTLAETSGGKFQRFAAFLPHSETPRTDASILQSNQSGISRAIENRDLVIIPDIAKELKKPAPRCVAGAVGSDNAGSMICYPIVDNDLGGVPFVITVKYSEPNYFTPDGSRRYRYILQAFATRIALENRLLTIKEATK